MFILTNATITTDDAAAEVALQGLEGNGKYRITHHGDEVTITLREDSGRFRRVDRLINAVKTDPKGGRDVYTFEGVSTMLIDNAHIPYDQAQVSFSATGTDGCPSCH